MKRYEVLSAVPRTFNHLLLRYSFTLNAFCCHSSSFSSSLFVLRESYIICNDKMLQKYDNILYIYLFEERNL